MVSLHRVWLGVAILAAYSAVVNCFDFNLVDTFKPSTSEVLGVMQQIYDLHVDHLPIQELTPDQTFARRVNEDLSSLPAPDLMRLFRHTSRQSEEEDLIPVYINWFNRRSNRRAADLFAARLIRRLEQISERLNQQDELQRHASHGGESSGSAPLPEREHAEPGAVVVPSETPHRLQPGSPSGESVRSNEVNGFERRRDGSRSPTPRPDGRS